MSFLQSIKTSYPIPFDLSIWNLGTGGVDLEVTLADSLEDLEGELELYHTCQATGSVTYMPEGTTAVVSAKLDQKFQGNKYVKYTYDTHANTCSVRYFPAIIKYKKKVTKDELDELRGPLKIYLRNYILVRMVEKEIITLKTVDLSNEVGSVNLEPLESFLESTIAKVTEMKDDITLYANS